MNEDKPALTADQNATDADADAVTDTGVDYPPETQGDARAKPTSRVVPALLVLCLIGVGVLGWQWWDMRSTLAKTQDELTRRLSESDDAARTARSGVNQVQDNVSTLQGKIGLLEAKAEESRGQAAALDSLYQEFSRSRDERLMAEVEQAVGIAGQQLDLAGNVEAGLIALQTAEAKLASAGDARLMPLRRSLARDIERLRAAPRVDIAGITLKLENLLDTVDGLPLAFTTEAAANPPPEKTPKGAFMDDPLAYLRALGKDLWAEIRSLIRVERIDASAEPVLLSPSQSTYLRENLKIRLLTARLALLGRDQRTFESDMTQAVDWLKRYFDTNEASVSSTLATLESLRNAQISPDKPALTETLAALATLQGRPVSAAPVEAEAGDPGGEATEPATAEPAPAESATPEPAPTEPATPEPAPTEPATTEPATTEPAPDATSSPDSASPAPDAAVDAAADATESDADAAEHSAETPASAVDAAESAPSHEASAETPAASPAKE